MAGVPQKSWWLGDGLVINRNHAFRGWSWGRSAVGGGWGEGFQGARVADRLIQDLGEGLSGHPVCVCVRACVLRGGGYTKMND